ncbi:NAD-dependent epimerase/dehydratase family protein [Chloroflexota bacterium]
MSILITGSGMVGAQAARILFERGERPVLYDKAPNLDFLSKLIDLNSVEIVTGDILDLSSVMQTIRSNEVSCIIHTAGLLTKYIRSAPYDGVKINVLGTATVLEAARLTGVNRVIYTSSGIVYYGAVGIPQKGVFDEDFDTKCLTGKPAGIYGFSKLSGEYLGLIYRELYGIEFSALRYSLIYGPWIGVPAGGGEMMARLVRAGVSGNQAVIEPSVAFAGRLQFLYSKDAGEAAVLACFAKEVPKGVYNISMAQAYELREVLDIAKKVFPKMDIDIIDIPKAGLFGYKPMEYPFDTSSAKREIGFEPRYSLEESLKDFAEWVRFNTL